MTRDESDEDNNAGGNTAGETKETAVFAQKAATTSSPPPAKSVPSAAPLLSGPAATADPDWQSGQHSLRAAKRVHVKQPANE